MNKIRKWFNKPKKEVENQLMIRALTPGRTHVACDDFTIVMETLSSTPQRLAPLLLDLRDLDGGLIGKTRPDGSDPDLILTTRLRMLRDLLQGDEVSDVQRQYYCPEPLRTTSACSPQTSAPLPVWSLLQVEQVTGNGMQMEPMDTGSCDIISLTPVGSGAKKTSASFPGHPVRSFLKTRDDCSLPSSSHSGGRRLPCSLPCSPLLGGRRWRSSPFSPSPPSGLSRLLVEAALQRSKQTEPRPPPPCSPQVRQEGEQVVVSKEGEREEDNDEEEEDKEVVGIRLSDTVIFRPMTSPSICGREGEGEEEHSDLLCLDSETSRYCLLTPCVCFRCPSAPPYEAEVFSAGDIQPVSSFSSEDQRHSECLTQLSQRTEVQSSEGDSEQSLPRDRAPHLGESSRLYPSLSLWGITADSQIELNRKQEEKVNSFDSHLDHDTIQSCFHGNSTDDHLQRLCEMISGVPGELQTLCSADLSFILKKVFDSTTCSKRTARPVESCSFCSDNLRIQIMKHLCRNCDKVFCSRCLCHFVSLLQIHQFSGNAAV